MKMTNEPRGRPRKWDIQLNAGGLPATMTITEAARTLGISRQLAYELARRFELPGCRKLGARYVVVRRVLDRWLDGGSG